jgi:hypothetical protein
MEESKDFYWAQFSSGNIHYVDDYYRIIEDKIFNLQLRYWVEAREKAQNLYPGNFKVEELLLILNLLCCSLETLAGVNIKPPEKNFTPSLMTMYRCTLKNEKGWNLEQEKPDLFNNLKEMDNLHNKLCKHINISDSRKELLKQISYEKIQGYIDATRNIWLWVLNKGFNGNIPESQLVFFQY